MHSSDNQLTPCHLHGWYNMYSSDNQLTLFPPCHLHRIHYSFIAVDSAWKRRAVEAIAHPLHYGTRTIIRTAAIGFLRHSKTTTTYYYFLDQVRWRGRLDAEHYGEHQCLHKRPGS